MLAVLTGCYDGLSGSAEGGDEQPEGEAPESGAEDDGGEGPSRDDEPVDGEAACSELGGQDLRILNAAQLERVVSDLLPASLAEQALGVANFPQTQIDNHFSTFATANRVNADDSMRFEDTAEAIADLVLADFDTHAPQLVPCLEGDTSEGSISGCADEFIETFGAKAFRRPLRDSEATIAREIFDSISASDGARAGLAGLLQFFLQAPQLLYVAEPGQAANADGLIKLSPHELATRLGLLFLDGPPDAALLDAAESGALETRADVEAQARRLSQQPELAWAMATFHHEWVRGYTLVDDRAHPLSTPDAEAALREELRAFATWFLDQPDARLADLLTTTAYVPDPRLDAIYAENDPQASQRKGLLTTAGAMASMSYADHTSLISRGVFLRSQVLCRPPPELPADVDPGELDDTSHLPTERERLEPLMTNPTCAGCHAAINPLGFPFEVYDWIGAYRTTENDAPIDTSADLTQILGPEYGTVADADELLDVIAQSDVARDCYARQWFRYALGRSEDTTGADDCALDQITSAFAASGGDVRELLVAIATSDAFLFRTEGQAQ